MRQASRITTFLLLLAALAARPAIAEAQTIRGTLMERQTDRPIVLGRVMLLNEAGDTVSATLTNGSGLFSLSSPQPGSFYMIASAMGYNDTAVGVFDLGEGGEMSVEFRIQPLALEIDGITVDVSGLVREPFLISNGFYQRMQMGHGRFITPADIEDAHALRASELFYSIPRVDVLEGGTGGDRIQMMSPMGSCSPPIYVDGMMVSNDGRDLDMVAPLHVIEAIEVYRGAAELPLQWGGTASQGCGAIIIWTKQGRP